ncbi:MAG: Ribonuclease [Candidatus Thorarchaeota archaeon]|nr:MAG: Ribonuclease [Candidatus Thorarchaeota archaeon]
MPVVIQIEKDDIDELERALNLTPTAVSKKPTNEYEAFRIQIKNGIVVCYTSGKVVITGAGPVEIVKDTIINLGIRDASSRFILGSDEAGKGEWLGPLTVSAVILTPVKSSHLRAEGVMDSKKLSLKRIAGLAQVIKENAEIVETVLISPEKFNKMFQDLHEENKNLNDLLAWAHAKAISKALEGIDSLDVKIVIDEFSRFKTNQRLSRVLQVDKFEIVQRPRAEEVISVASASIVARDAREEWIDRASTRLGIELKSLTPSDAKSHSKRNKFAKVEWLK